MCPQPRRTNSRAVAGTVARAGDEPVVLRPGERERDVDLGQPGEAARPHARVGGLEAGRVRVGAHELQRRGVRHPLRVRDRRRRARPGARARCAAARGSTGPQRAGERRAPASACGRSGCAHSPAGAIAVTDRAWPASASSSATQPPSELPATCGRSRPSAARCAWIAAASSRGVTRGARDRRRTSPKPGMSSAITSRSAASRSSTGSHMWRSVPSACRSTSGGPLPVRVRDHALAARTAAVSAAEPPATAAVFGGASSGSPARPANVAAMSVRSPAMLTSEPRPQRRAAQRGGDRRSRAARSRARRGRAARPSRSPSTAGPSQDCA